MYAALWNILPGPIWLRIIIVAILAVAAVAALFTWVFPWFDGIVNPQQSTLGISQVIR
ncbi:MAG TPA: hypothetical protein VK139_01545 [Microbacteriaceae bacterium]|nr:hypothetical protein [Microbacteriaceae bacterium]